VSTFARFRTAGPLFALAAGALAFDADPRLPWIAGVAAAAFFASAAVLRTVQADGELRRARRSADRLILAHERVTWRERELAEPRSREHLRREIDRLLRAASPARLPSSSPLNRVAVRRSSELFRSLGRQPLTPRGVLLLQQLLRDARSPLYSDQAEELVPRALARILTEIER
jgi:hypothetical protein